MTDTATPITPYIHAAHQVTDLEDWGALEEATGAAMSTSGMTLWTGQGDQEVGIWECTPGPSHAGSSRPMSSSRSWPDGGPCRH